MKRTAARGTTKSASILAAAAAAYLFCVAPRAAFASDPVRPADSPLDLHEDAPPPLQALPPEYLVHDGGWATVGYHPSTRDRARPLFQRIDAIRQELRALLGDDVLSDVEVRIAAVPEELPRLTPVDTPPGRHASSSTSHRLVVMTAQSPLVAEAPDLEATLRHQLAHLALDEAVHHKPIPAWFHEAFARYFAGDDTMAAGQTLTMAALRGRLVGYAQLPLSLPEEVPQAAVVEAQRLDFVRFLVDARSENTLRPLVERVAAGDSFDEALQNAYGSPTDEIGTAWREDMAKRYSFLPVLVGSALMWMLLATLALWRRARRRRQQQESDAESPVTPRVRIVNVRARPRRASRDAEESDVPESVPPTGVPKVEHDGRWHTLH